MVQLLGQVLLALISHNDDLLEKHDGGHLELVVGGTEVHKICQGVRQHN